MPDSYGHTTEMKVLELAFQQFYSQARMPAGLRRVEFESYANMMADEIIMQMRAMMLAEDGGPETTDTVAWLSPLRPWWIPKFLWRRIPTKHVRYTLTCQPKYLYPHATVRVPELGQPVRFAYMSPPWNTRDGSDWRDDNPEET